MRFLITVLLSATALAPLHAQIQRNIPGSQLVNQYTVCDWLAFNLPMSSDCSIRDGRDSGEDKIFHFDTYDWPPPTAIPGPCVECGPPAQVPEPSTLFLLGSGILAVALRKRRLIAAALLLLVGITASAQGPLSPVAIDGNSIARYEQGMQSWMYRGIQPTPLISGHDGSTCTDFEQNGWLDQDVPAPTPTVVLILGTNEANPLNQTQPREFVACMAGLIRTLQSRNPAVRIVLTSVPPWNQETNLWPWWDPRPLIAAYNSGLASLVAQYQNVAIADEHTTFDRGDGWANPALINYLAVHPGPYDHPTLGWAQWALEIRRQLP